MKKVLILFLSLMLLLSACGGKTTKVVEATQAESIVAEKQPSKAFKVYQKLMKEEYITIDDALLELESVDGDEDEVVDLLIELKKLSKCQGKYLWRNKYGVGFQYCLSNGEFYVELNFNNNWHDFILYSKEKVEKSTVQGYKYHTAFREQPSGDLVEFEISENSMIYRINGGYNGQYKDSLFEKVNQ